MADQDEPNVSSRVESQLTAAQPRAVADGFVEDAYLRAFPAVAQAISEGLFASGLQHYLEYGHSENRLSSEEYRAVQRRAQQIPGHIDFYGYDAPVKAWLFCGWSSERWDETEPVRATAHFATGSVSEAAITGFYVREGLPGLGTGLILSVPGEDEPLSNLACIDVQTDTRTLTITSAQNAQQMAGRDLAAAVRSALQDRPQSENCRGLAERLGTVADLSVFFDPAFYLQRNTDVAAANVDPLAHFIEWGVSERRMPHPLIDIAYMSAIATDLLADPLTIETLHDVLCRDMVDSSPYFSRDFYRSQLDGSELIRNGLLHHFLETGMLRGLRPNPAFDPPAGGASDVRATLRARLAPAGFPRLQTDNIVTDETEAGQVFRTKADAARLFLGRNPLRFDFSGAPDISAILVVHDDFALTLLTLASLRSNYAGSIELILIDSASRDETRHLGRYVSGGVLLQFDTGIDYLRGRNAALEVASADTVLFLNSDVELGFRAVAAGLDRLRSDPTAGAVGAKLLRSNGVLREAGGMTWRNEPAVLYRHGDSPLVPEANFVRDVDFCSAIFLLARTRLLREIGGFDAALASSFLEDADLCLRMAEAGWRTVYDPAIGVHQLGAQATANAAVVPLRMEAAHAIFVAKHSRHLRSGDPSDDQAHLFARSIDREPGRVLLIEDQLPLRRLGSGFVRCNDIIGIIAGLGFHVTVYPVDPTPQDLAAVYADFPDRVEVMHASSLRDLGQFLKQRRGYYNVIWIARTHNLDLVAPLLQAAGDDLLNGVHVVLDTEVIAATREAQRLALTDPAAPFDVAEAIRKELRHAHCCQTVVAVNPREAATLLGLGIFDVRVVGHIRQLALTPQPWAQRAGMLFTGAMHQTDTPNYDSLCWFVDNVLPLIERELGYETRLTITGFVTDGVDLERFRSHRRITLRGTVTNMAPLYDAHRVFVAPTRYAGGIPYKVHEAASFGLPVVATEVLRQQLGWEDGQDILAADARDPEQFARQVVALYRSETLWNHIRTGAAERIRTECGREACEQTVAAILRQNTAADRPAAGNHAMHRG